MPANTPLPSLRITQGKNILQTQSDSFSFAVLGDMRWTSEPRITILKDAQRHKPLFMVNLGDPVEFGNKDEWARYMNELAGNWNRITPYFHIPGGHSINVRLNGVYPAFYECFFGRTYYAVDAGDWRFTFLDTSKTYIPDSQMKWLLHILNDSRKRGKRNVIFSHCPPKSAEHGVTHSLTAGSTKNLARIVSGHNVAAIFAGHIHKSLNYTWQGIPVHITSLHGSTWTNEQPANYLKVSIAGRQMKVETVILFRNSKGYITKTISR